MSDSDPVCRSYSPPIPDTTNLSPALSRTAWRHSLNACRNKAPRIPTSARLVLTHTLRFLGKRRQSTGWTTSVQDHSRNRWHNQPNRHVLVWMRTVGNGLCKLRSCKAIPTRSIVYVTDLELFCQFAVQIVVRFQSRPHPSPPA